LKFACLNDPCLQDAWSEIDKMESEIYRTWMTLADSCAGNGTTVPEERSVGCERIISMEDWRKQKWRGQGGGREEKQSRPDG